MTAVRHWTRQHELFHWLLVIVTAIALTLLVARVLGAAEPAPEPRLLPDDMGQFAKPMSPESARPFFPETPPVRQLPPAEAAARLQMILEHHRAGRTLEAINEWKEVGLPTETAHWREIALGAAYLRSGDLDRADRHLAAAQQWMPGHPIAHYFVGLLRLVQADTAAQVPDRMNHRDLLVSYTPIENRAIYRLMAIRELELAIARAHEVRLEEPLVGADPQEYHDFAAPTAGDLLVALGADNFVGKSHNVLFGLHMDQGELMIAELHLDAAVQTGIAPLNGYRDLAERHLLVGQNRDAVRLARKDFEANCPELAQAIHWLLRSEQPALSWTW